jgi:uncharacterized PurR-regulated membrane protein YhhQ (DUF165 family)
MLWFLAFLATIPAANWLVVNVGLIPVGFGLAAPSGVLLAGLALVLRDLVHRDLGPWAALAAILGGAVLSVFLAPPALIVASTAAFLLSELADLAIYAPLRRRGFILAVVASSAVGLVIDSAVFLWLAFGSFEYLTGQIVGKAEMLALATVFLITFRRRHVLTRA